MASDLPHDASSGETTTLLRVNLVTVTKTATFALVDAPFSAPTSAPTSAISETAGSAPYINWTSEKIVALIFGPLVILLFYYAIVMTPKPKRITKPTPKARARSDSDDGDDDDFDDPQPKSKKPEPKTKARAKARAKIANRKGNKVEHVLSDDDDSDWEDMVDYLTTNPKSPFANIDLIVSPLPRYTLPEPAALSHFSC